MKSKRIISIILLIALLCNINYADVIYQKSEEVTFKEDIVDELSRKINSVHTILEIKDIVNESSALDFITFGKANLSTDPSMVNDIEWLVLDKTNDTAILVSRAILGKSEYYSKKDGAQYAGTEISKWINKFVDKSFNIVEKKAIIRNRLLTASELDKYFKKADGTYKLALANTAINGTPSDYWLMNEETSHEANYFSIYGTILNAYLGEEFGVRIVLEVKYNK